MNESSKIVNILLHQNPLFIPAVVGFPIRDDEVLLMRRKSTQMGLGEGLVSGIGGKVGDLDEFPNETSTEALIREMAEEIGITPVEFSEVGRVRFVWTHKSTWNMDVKIYLVTLWNGDPRETDVAEPFWFKKDALPKERMWEDNRYWVPRVLAGERIDAVFIYGEDKTVVDYSLKLL